MVAGLQVAGIEGGALLNKSLKPDNKHNCYFHKRKHRNKNKCYKIIINHTVFIIIVVNL